MENFSNNLCTKIIKILNKNKGINITKIDLKDKSSIADFMVICSGTSSRHIIALSDFLNENLKKLNLKTLSVEGKKGGDWILVDAGDVIIHLFRNEVRDYYSLEKMWDPKIISNIEINS